MGEMRLFLKILGRKFALKILVFCGNFRYFKVIWAVFSSLKKESQWRFALILSQYHVTKIQKKIVENG